jgi:hypothetical protein
VPLRGLKVSRMFTSPAPRAGGRLSGGAMPVTGRAWAECLPEKILVNLVKRSLAELTALVKTLPFSLTKSWSSPLAEQRIPNFGGTNYHDPVVLPTKIRYTSAGRRFCAGPGGASLLRPVTAGAVVARAPSGADGKNSLNGIGSRPGSGTCGTGLDYSAPLGQI